MKRTLAAMAALLALTCMGLFTSRLSPTAASFANVASASGSGHAGDLSLSFGAADHGDLSYTGQATFVYESSRQKVTIDVECMSVNGNHARMTGTVTKSTNPTFPAATSVSFDVLDNGEGAGAAADQFSPPRPGSCGSIKPEAPVFNASDRGNIQVRFVAPDKDCTKCPAGTHCAGNGECVGGGGGGTHCPSGYYYCCSTGSCIPDFDACQACPIGK